MGPLPRKKAEPARHRLGQDRVLHVEGDHSLARAGDVARGVYLIESGAARPGVRDAEGRVTRVQFFSEGIASSTTADPGTRPISTDPP